MAKKIDPLPFAVIAVVLTAVMIPVLKGAKMINAEARECEAKGGSHVKTYEGFACIKAPHIK